MSPRIGTNTGHGHVWARPDGAKARCGGPGICRECSQDMAQQEAATASPLTPWRLLEAGEVVRKGDQTWYQGWHDVGPAASGKPVLAESYPVRRRMKEEPEFVAGALAFRGAALNAVVALVSQLRFSDKEPAVHDAKLGGAQAALRALEALPIPPIMPKRPEDCEPTALRFRQDALNAVAAVVCAFRESTAEPITKEARLSGARCALAALEDVDVPRLPADAAPAAEPHAEAVRAVREWHELVLHTINRMVKNRQTPTKEWAAAPQAQAELAGLTAAWVELGNMTVPGGRAELDALSGDPLDMRLSGKVTLPQAPHLGKVSYGRGIKLRLLIEDVIRWRARVPSAFTKIDPAKLAEFRAMLDVMAGGAIGLTPEQEALKPCARCEIPDDCRRCATCAENGGSLAP